MKSDQNIQRRSVDLCVFVNRLSIISLIGVTTASDF